MKKNKIFDLSAISIVACDCLQAVITIFIDLFFISQILNYSNGDTALNIIYIGLFYLIEYIILALSYRFSGFILKKINKSIFVSIGAVLLTVVVLMVYLLHDNIISYVALIAVVYGIAWGFFSSGFNNLTAETISSKHQVRFFAVKKIMFQLTYIIFPVTLGLIIDNINFGFMALIMLVICALLIMFSFLIKPKKTYKLSFNVKAFSIYLRKNSEQTKPLWLVYISTFFRGASFDCFTTLITILVMRTFQSNTDLGMFQSIFTGCSLLTMAFYLKFYRKRRAKWFMIPTIVLVACTVVGVMISTNKVSIICFTAVYSILNVILMSISDSRRAGVVRTLSLHSHILESNAFTEFFLGAGRIISTLAILFSGVFDSLTGGTIFLKLALVWVCGMYIMYGLSLCWLEKSLIKQDEEFRKAHAQEQIEKNED